MFVKHTIWNLTAFNPVKIDGSENKFNIIQRRLKYIQPNAKPMKFKIILTPDKSVTFAPFAKISILFELNHDTITFISVSILKFYL